MEEIKEKVIVYKKRRMLSETKNWFGLALSSPTADVYCTRELSRRVNVPLINPAVPCTESAVPTSK